MSQPHAQSTSVGDDELDDTFEFLVTAYPNQRTPNLEAYARVLRERVERGALLYAAETWWAEPRFKPDNKFWPTPADLVDLAADQGKKPISAQEWDELLKPDLGERLQILKDYFAEGVLEGPAWRQLAADYKQRGGTEAAAAVMRGYEVRQAMQEGTFERRFSPARFRDSEAQIEKLRAKLQLETV